MLQRAFYRHPHPGQGEALALAILLPTRTPRT